MTDAVRLKTRSAARRVSLSAVICALSVITPQIFHLFGGQVAGNAFLPMHIPVLLGGFLLPPGAAMVCGALSPVLSFFLTGMSAMPRLIFMVLELGAYGFFASLFARKLRLPTFLSLVLSMLCGRAVYFVSVVAVLHVFHLQIPGMTSATAAVWAAVSTGVPGILLQLVLIPVLVAALKKAGLIPRDKRTRKL